MKFGRYIDEEKATFVEDWRDRCIDYGSLKLFIKLHIADYADVNPITDVEGLSSKLYTTQKQVPEFIRMLNENVERMNCFYIDQISALPVDTKLGSTGNMTDRHTLLQAVIALENFAFLNYTAIVKVLKKLDRRSGLHLSQSYLTSLTSLEFYRSERIALIKPVLLASLGTGSGNVAIPEASQISSLPPLIRGQVANTNCLPPTHIFPNQKVLITMNGAHGTDIIGALLTSLAHYAIKIEDFVFSRVQHDVTFGCLITLSADTSSLFQTLAYHAKKWSAQLLFTHQASEINPTPLDAAPYPNRAKYTATVLNQSGLSSEFLDKWMKLLLKYKISVEKMVRLSSEYEVLSCADFKLSVPEEIDFDAFRSELFSMSAEYGTDVALQLFNVFRKNKRLFIFDMDSTLIQQEVIDEIARHAGVLDQVSEITEAAMNGEIDFKESLKRRVALLKGTPVSVLDTIKDNLIYTEGAQFLCQALKKLGYKLAVISGGFMPLALHVKNQLGLDYAFANTLKVSADGLYLTGETVGPIVDAHRKSELLEVIAQAESVTPEQVVAVGDGANDLLMLAAAGLGIAFNAKVRVQKEAKARINQRSLKNILYLLGYSDEDALQLA